MDFTREYLLCLEKMEEHPIKLDYVSPAMTEFIAKLQSFDALSSTEQKSLLLREILTAVEDLKNSLKKSAAETNCKTQSFYDNQIERVFSEFNWNVNYTMKPNEYKKFISCCKTLAASVMRMLGRKNCGILVVELYFKMNIKLINELSESVEGDCNVLKDLLLFQLLIKGYLSSVKVLKRFWYVIVLPEQKCSVLLCLNQSYKTLCFLAKVIDKRLTHLIVYLLNRVKHCFQKILDLFFKNVEDCLNSEFIIVMDCCLNKLDQMVYEFTLQEDSNNPNAVHVTTLKPLLDELLCHAMTVSHISSRESDCELIKSYSQKVLDEYKNMEEKGLDSPDLGSRADRLSIILCQLEEIVNVAVLNVVLDVFIDVNDPLRNLVNKCNGQQPESGVKCANDLEYEISAFDEHMDRVIQIGLFAVSCSTDVKRILEIRSCLASMESLEAELVTSVISLYLHPNCDTKTTFQYVFRNWLEEMIEFKNLMDLVLDPTAFCKVVEKRITSLLYEMKNDDSISMSNIRSALNKILSYTKKLIKTLVRSIEHDDEETKKKMQEFVDNLRIAYQECEASLSLLDAETPSKEVLERIIKRIILIIRAINNIIRNIDGVNNASDDAIDVYGEFSSFRITNNEGKHDIYNINAITPEQRTELNMEVLTPYINRGKQRTKDRTVLYPTPKHSQHFQNMPNTLERQPRPWQEGSQARTRMRCCRPLPRRLELENSLDLELTILLDNVSDLSNTFKSSYGDTGRENEEPNDEDVKRVITTPGPPEKSSDEQVFLGTLMRRKLDQALHDLNCSTSLSINKDSNYRYDTPERLHDLTLVEQKINFLMEHMKEE